MADLPDYYTQAQISEAEAASVKGGLDANKSATPVSRQIYLATDTSKLFYCVVDGAWVDVTHACLLLAGGTMSGNIVMGGNKVTGLGAPAAQDDALRYNRLEIRNAEIAAAAAIARSKLDFGAGLVNADIAAGAAILVSKLVNTYFPETLMTTQGDLLIRGAANPERLAKITTGEVLRATATGYEGVALPTVAITTGQYTGNDTANRAIAHGLGATPKLIFIFRNTLDNPWLLAGSVGGIYNLLTAYLYAVTIPNATNFYVGNATSYPRSANSDTYVYDWVAIRS